MEKINPPSPEETKEKNPKKIESSPSKKTNKSELPPLSELSDDSIKFLHQTYFPQRERNPEGLTEKEKERKQEVEEEARKRKMIS